MLSKRIESLPNAANIARAGCETGKLVLCATDLTARSHPAVLRAALMAKKLKAQLLLLHVAPIYATTIRRARLRRQLEAQCAILQRLCEHVPQACLLSGELVPAIARFARRLDADLIVMGSRWGGTNGQTEGTAAERLVLASACPVLVVNQFPQRDGTYGEIAIAAPLSHTLIELVEAAAALDLLSRASGAVVHGFGAAPHKPPVLNSSGLHQGGAEAEAWHGAIRGQVREALHAAGAESSRFRVYLRQLLPPNMLECITEWLRPDLLVVGANGTGTGNRLVDRPGADQTLWRTQCDVLVASAALVH